MGLITFQMLRKREAEQQAAKEAEQKREAEQQAKKPATKTKAKAVKDGDS